MTATNNDTLQPSLATADYAPESRVWVYAANRALTDAETQFIREALHDFTRQWTAHNQALRAAAEVFQNQFILLLVDETLAGASGCSIDKSTHVLEALGHQLGIDLFDRMRFAWVEDDRLRFSDRNGLIASVESSEIQPDTLMVNTLVQTQRDLQEKWLVPFSQSWHRRIV
ncbi:MAG: ABC transporter ATPase [Saprospiraceae bacterium]